MTTSIFINALGQAIFESCGQALLIYVVLQLFMQLFPSISSKYKYDINYLGLTIISCWFLANLVKIYLHNVSLPAYNIAVYTGHVITGTKNIPTLLQQAEAFIVTYAKYITGLYMIGLTLHAFKLIGGFVHIHHIRKQQNLSEDGTWTAKAVQLCNQLKIVKTVRLYFSTQVDIPLTIGYFKPIIIFPIALINCLDTEQVEAILLHELAHIKRHDYLLNILQCIMETLLCFNPFVWLISKTIRQEREYCCDDMVMDEEYNNFTYSKALYIIAQQNSQNYALAMASAGKNKYPLLNRIKRLNSMKTNDSLPKFHLLVIVAVAAVSGLLAWGIPQYSHAKETNRAHHKLVKPLPPSAPVAPLTIPPAPPLPPATKMTVRFYADTTGNKAATDSIISHSKAKFKIVLEDDKGNKKEYNSVQELPDSEKSEFLKENPAFGDFEFKFRDSLKFAHFKDFKMDPKFQQQILAMKTDAEKMRRQFENDPKWKEQALKMKLDAEKMSKQFNSPEWNKQVNDLKLQAEKMKNQLNSPEFQKQIEDMKIEAEKMKELIKNDPEWQKQALEMKLQAEQISKQVNSAVWKAQVKEMKKQAERMNKQFNSPEWKKQMEDMQETIKKEVDENLQKANLDSVKTAN
jgi:beta-lactamase regulating signal transducer with metallopeptidase domain